MEYCEGGDLRGLLDKARVGEVDFGHGDQCNMLLDIAYGMRYLHGRPSPVIHGDLKSLNILVGRDGSGKVADFGRSQSNSTNSHQSQRGSGVGTMGWTAPEVIDEGSSAVSLKADVYSFAIVMWECITQKIPWDGKTDGQIIKAIIKEQRPDVSDDMNKDLRALMESCWSEDPKDRPHFDEIVERLEAITPTKTKTVLRTSSNISSVSEDGTGDLWERLKADCEATGSNIPVGDDLVMAFEGLFLDGDDVEDRDALISLLDINKNGAVSKPEFKKFLAKWKKSGKSMEAYLGNTGGPPPPTPADTRNGFKFTSNDQLKEAAKEWVEDKEKAKGKYGKIEDWDVSEVTSFHELFEEAKEFNEDLSRWDVSNVTSMYYAFCGCSAFNSDLSTWNTSHCTNMRCMFHSCSAFNSDLSTWNTSNCTDMNCMFYSCSAFNSDLSTWNTSKCTDMQGMFHSCSAFNSDLSTWNTSNCTNMKGMFGGCSAFNSDISTWNTSNCTNMANMFNGCSAFNSDISKWDTSNCTNMRNMFVDCSAFNSDISKWNTSNCTTMECMFYGCSAFNSDLSTWKTSNCTDMRAMFYNATSFNNDLSLWDMSKCINKTDMFLNATAMKASHKPKGV
jgi:surface protein